MQSERAAHTRSLLGAVRCRKTVEILRRGVPFCSRRCCSACSSDLLTHGYFRYTHATSKQACTKWIADLHFCSACYWTWAGCAAEQQRAGAAHAWLLRCLPLSGYVASSSRAVMYAATACPLSVALSSASGGRDGCAACRSSSSCALMSSRWCALLSCLHHRLPLLSGSAC